MNQAVKEKVLKFIICFILAAATWAAFAAVADFPFIALDDGYYVLNNAHIQQGFSWKAIKWAFTAFYANNWHPLTWLSHMLDCRLYGLAPAGPHLTNLAFHVADTVLLFFLLYNLTAKLWPAAFVAMLFGIHPMHVESVAWVSERKDVLSAFFFLLTLLAYARYVELANAKKKLCWTVYGFALLLFALGLLSKPMLVTLPGILCLMDYWPFRRIQLPLKKRSPVLRRLVIEKIPFIILSALSCWITYYVQNSTGAVKLATLDSPMQRLEHMPVAYSWYLLKCFWPVNLSVYNRLPYHESDEPVAWAALFVLGITAFALLRVRKYPWFFVGWFWFIGMLVPVIGLVQVGNQAYADRYTYLPYIGLFFIITWGTMELLSKIPRRQPVLWSIAILITAVCFWRTRVEAAYWKNGLTLFQRAVALEPDNEMAWNLVGNEYENNGNLAKAIDCLTRSTTLNNQFNLGWYNLGRTLARAKNYAEAVDAYQSGISCTYFNGDKGKFYSSLADVYTTTGQYDQAIADYQESLQLSPGQVDVQASLAKCFLDNGQPDQAIAACQDAVKLDPDYREAQLNLAMLLGNAGRDAEAIPHYWKVIELDTNVLIALNNLSWMLATDSDPHLRDGKAAIPLMLHACERTHYQEAFLIGTLAAAYAEAGQFDKAAAAAQKAHDVALAHGQKELADTNGKLMQLYKSGKPFHMDKTKN